MTQTAMARSNGQAPARKPAVMLQDALEQRKDMMAAVLPKHLTPERMIQLATVAMSKTPALAKCSLASVVTAVMKAAELGLDCSGTLGSAYLVPYGNDCTLIIGYRGMIDLARRSGQITSIEARVVYQNDLFEFEYGLEPRLKHVPEIDGDPGALRLVYGVAKLRDGATQIEVMNKSQIDGIRNRSRAGKSGPWVTDYAEMARKTVVKRLCKYLPLSVELSEAIAVDNAADPIEAPPAAPAKPSLADRLLEEPPAEPEVDQETGEVTDAAPADDFPADPGFTDPPATDHVAAALDAPSAPAQAQARPAGELATYADWYSAMEQAAQDKGDTLAALGEAIKALKLKHDLLKDNASGRKARAAALAEYQAKGGEA